MTAIVTTGFPVGMPFGTGLATVGHVANDKSTFGVCDRAFAVGTRTA